MLSHSDIISSLALAVSLLSYNTARRSRKDQRNKEEKERIENALTKFYIPVSDILNKRKTESLETVVIYGQYKYLANEETSKVYEKYTNLFKAINNYNKNEIAPQKLSTQSEFLDVRKELQILIEKDIEEYKLALKKLKKNI